MIKRHDALHVCDIIYHCLLKEKSGTHCEQGYPIQSFNRPGDMYHQISLRENLHALIYQSGTHLAFLYYQHFKQSWCSC